MTRCSLCKATSDDGVLMHELGCSGETVEQRRGAAAAAVTADTVTDEQIDLLYSDGRITSLSRTIAKRLMRGPRVGASAYEERRERECCAEIWNARHAKDGGS